MPGRRLSKRKKPFESVVAVTGRPAPSRTGAPAGSSRFSFAPKIPGDTPSAALSVPELSLSFQTRLPRLKGKKKPKSTVSSDWLSPTGPWLGPPPRSARGSPPETGVPGPRVTTPEQTPFVAGAAASMPLSFESLPASGSASVVLEEVEPRSTPAPEKLLLSTQTLTSPGARPSKRKKPSVSVVCWATPATGLPAESTRFTFAPATPGFVPSAALIVPELSVSAQTRFPMLKGTRKPKSTVRLSRRSPVGPFVPPPVSTVVSGSFPGPRVTTPEVIPPVAGVAESTPLSFLSTLVSGLASVTAEEM